MAAEWARSDWLRPLNDTTAINELLGSVEPTWSLTEIRARIIQVIRETPDTRTLVLRPNRLWPGHRAGQHVVVEVDIDGRRHLRAFSLSSPPSDPGRLHLTIKRQPAGRVSRWCNEAAAIGDVVTLRRPSGDFVLPRIVPQRIVMLSAGSGITPVMAMLRELRARTIDTDIVFVHSTRTRRDWIFAEELEQLATRWPRLDLRVCFTAHDGRLTRDDMDDLAASTRGALTYVCGPPDFLATARAAWREAGVEELLHHETFGMPRHAANHATTQAITTTQSGRTFLARKDEPLLAAAEAAGLRPPHGCRAGICHSCLCRKVEGTIEDLRTGRISDEPGEQIQLCVSSARSPVTIEI